MNAGPAWYRVVAQTALGNMVSNVAHLYANNFEGAIGSEWSSDDTDTNYAQTDTYLGQFGTQAITLDLAGLPDHAGLNVTFDLHLIGHWNGQHWRLQADGDTIADRTFSNLLPLPDGAAGDTLGYSGDETWAHDSTYHMSYNFADDAASPELTFQGLSLPSGVTWGIDNVHVSTDPQPEFSGEDIAPVAGVAMEDVTVGHVDNPDGSAEADDYTASIDWGDGASATAGTVADAQYGGFDILGSHEYDTPGDYTAVITLTDVNGVTTVIRDSVTVSALAAPDNLAAEATSPSEVDLSWDSAGAESYIIYRGTSSSFSSMSEIGTADGPAYSDTTVSPATHYYYRVAAVVGEDSDVSDAADAATGLDSPTGLYGNTSNPGTPRANIFWNAVAGATGYEVYRAADGDDTFTLAGTASASSYPSFTDTGVGLGTAYTYFVQATAGTVESEQSDPLREITPEEQPSAPHAVNIYQREIDIAWDAVTAPHTGYCILRNGNVIGYVAGNTTVFADTGLTPGGNYSYTIAAMGPDLALLTSGGPTVTTPTSGTVGEARPTITVWASQPYGIYEPMRPVTIEVYRTGDHLSAPLPVTYGLSEHHSGPGNSNGAAVATGAWDFTGQDAAYHSPGNYCVTIGANCSDGTLTLTPMAGTWETDIRKIEMRVLADASGSGSYAPPTSNSAGAPTAAQATVSRLKWAVARKGGAGAAAKMAVPDATWEDLAQIVNLSATDYKKWVWSSHPDLTSPSEPPFACETYYVPNVVQVVIGQSYIDSGIDGEKSRTERRLERWTWTAQAMEMAEVMVGQRSLTAVLPTSPGSVAKLSVDKGVRGGVRPWTGTDAQGRTKIIHWHKDYDYNGATRAFMDGAASSMKILLNSGYDYHIGYDLLGAFRDQTSLKVLFNGHSTLNTPAELVTADPANPNDADPSGVLTYARIISAKPDHRLSGLYVGVCGGADDPPGVSPWGHLIAEGTQALVYHGISSDYGEDPTIGLVFLHSDLQ